jgi:hypothetical protein
MNHHRIIITMVTILLPTSNTHTTHRMVTSSTITNRCPASNILQFIARSITPVKISTKSECF